MTASRGVRSSWLMRAVSSAQSWPRFQPSRRARLAASAIPTRRCDWRSKANARSSGALTGERCPPGRRLRGLRCRCARETAQRGKVRCSVRKIGSGGSPGARTAAAMARRCSPAAAWRARSPPVLRDVRKSSFCPSPRIDGRACADRSRGQADVVRSIPSPSARNVFCPAQCPSRRYAAQLQGQGR